jgi:hypothetical protein
MLPIMFMAVIASEALAFVFFEIIGVKICTPAVIGALLSNVGVGVKDTINVTTFGNV